MGGANSTPSPDSAAAKKDTNANAIPAECPMHNKADSATNQPEQVNSIKSIRHIILKDTILSKDTSTIWKYTHLTLALRS